MRRHDAIHKVIDSKSHQLQSNLLVSSVYVRKYSVIGTIIATVTSFWHTRDKTRMFFTNDTFFKYNNIVYMNI